MNEYGQLTDLNKINFNQKINFLYSKTHKPSCSGHDETVNGCHSYL